MNKGKSILFVANVQGPELVAVRGIKRNLSIAGNTKVFGICEALSGKGQRIGIYSPGTAAERIGRFHAAMKETVGPSNTSAWYGASIDNRILRMGIELVALITTLPKLIKMKQVGIVIVYNLTFLTLVASVIARLKGCKLILEYEDSALVSRTKKPPLRKGIFRLQEQLMERWCFGVYAPSSELLDAVGIENRLLLPGALNSSLIEASIDADPQTAEVSSKSPLKLLYAGGFDESKGVDRFLAAVEQIDASLEIHICGNGPLAEDLKKGCERSRHKAVFHGLVDRTELIKLQTTCQVGLNPHRGDLHAGGAWPFKVVEYLAACGTVFCSRSGNIPEDLANQLFLYDGDSVDEIAEALRALIEKWPEMSQAAHKRRKWAIEQFGPVGVAEKLESLFTGDVVPEWKGV